MKRYIFPVTFGLALAMGLSTQAEATTITCTGSASSGARSSVFYDSSAGTCVIADIGLGSYPTVEAYDLSWRFRGSFSVEGWAETTGDATASRSEHNGCTLSNVNYTAGTTCSTTSYDSGETGSFSRVDTIKGTNAAGDPVTLTVNASGWAGSSMGIDSASVQIGALSSSGGNAVQAAQAVNSAVARSQTKVVSANIGARFSSISTGATGSVNTGTGRTVEQAQNSLTQPAFGFDAMQPVDTSRGVKNDQVVRELAMMASFDSSELMLGAAEKGKTDGVLAPQDREALLADRPITVWGHGSYTNLENDRLSGSEDNRYDGNVWGYNIGVDYRFSQKLYAGVSLGYSETDLSTTYNNGEYDETNWSLSPYAVYKPIDPLKLSILAGYSTGDLDLSRDNGAVTGDTDSDMWFLNVNADYVYRPNKKLPLDLTGSLGFLTARKTVDAYQESDGTNVDKITSNTRQLKTGVEAAYTFNTKGTSIQPFAKVDFLYDITDATNGDKFAYDLGGGLRLGNAKTGLSGAIEAETQLGRDDYSEYSISGMIAYGFSLGAKGDTNASQLQPFVKSDYSADSQSLGTGVKYIDGSGDFDAGVNVFHAAGEGNASDSTTAMLGLNLKF